MKVDVQQIKQRFGIIGNNPGLNRAIDVALQVAPTDLSVLITGESGVGKETFPQIIHQNSQRKHGQYIAVNCGAIPEGTIDSELFGHEKGSFTGALADRKGYFEVADGGTIFLDEVGELPTPTQARLLRVLETGEFIKVGSSKVQKTNVRIVAATNVNVEKYPVLVKQDPDQKIFNSEREILYQVLFDMKKDVNELKKLVHDIMGGNIPMPTVADDTPYAHPIHPAAVHAMHPTIQDAEDVEEETLSLEEVEKEMIRKALEKHNGRRKNAAADLKISERTLYRKIKEYNLE